MATASDLITRALRRVRAIGKDQVLTADEAADALAELNDMLAEWRNDGLIVFRIVQENFALVAGQASRTIGPTGNFATTRPLKILEGCFVRRSGVDHQVKVLDDRTLFDRWPVKTTQGLVEALYYDPTVTNGTLYFKPVPDAADTIFLNSPAPIHSTLTLVTTVSLPPGYDGLVVSGLGIRCAPEYGVEPPASVLRAFGRTMRSIKRTNTRGVVMSTDPALIGHTGYANIRGAIDS